MSEFAPVVFGVGVSNISSAIEDTTITLMDQNGNRMTSIDQVTGWDEAQFLEDLILQGNTHAESATLVLTGEQFPGDPETSLAIFIQHIGTGTLGRVLQRYNPTRPALYGPQGEPLDAFAFIPSA